jgi:hypothetical protein
MDVLGIKSNKYYLWRYVSYISLVLKVQKFTMKFVRVIDLFYVFIFIFSTKHISTSIFFYLLWPNIINKQYIKAWWYYLRVSMLLRINYMNIKKNNISFSLGKKRERLSCKSFFLKYNFFFKRGNVSNKIRVQYFRSYLKNKGYFWISKILEEKVNLIR